MIRFRKIILKNWPVLLIILPVIFAASFTTQLHNHDSVTEPVNCPAHFANLFFIADQLADITLSPVARPVFQVIPCKEMISDYSYFTSFSNRTPPIV